VKSVQRNVVERNAAVRGPAIRQYAGCSTAAPTSKETA
jgi:hypothetical protein